MWRVAWLGLASAARLSEREPRSLCQRQVVQESCELIANSRNDVSGVEVVSFSELQGALHCSFDSLVNYMDFIGLEGSLAESYRVRCSDLCTLTVQSLPPAHVPPAIDTACYKTREGVTCDIDVSDASYENVTFETPMPDRSEVENRTEPRPLQIDNDTIWQPDTAPVEEFDGDSLDGLPENIGVDQMRISVANLFRIYPPFELEVRNDTHAMSPPSVSPDVANISGTSGSSLLQRAGITNADCYEAVPGSRLRSRSFWLSLTFNGRKCKCPTGSVVRGKHRRCTSRLYVDDRRKFDPKDLASADCSCVAESSSYEVIPPDCEDRYPTGFRDFHGRVKGCKRLKARCSEKAVYDVCPTTCKSTCLLGLEDEVEEKEQWEIDVAKRAVEAQAYVSKALRRMGARKATRELRTWFGETGHWTRETVKGILNGVHRLLSNVDYIYDKNECSTREFAFVRPHAPFNKNRRGRYIFYLCPLYMRSKKDAQINTLTHEASHHENMFTDDMCQDGSTKKKCERAYGRTACKTLARNEPESAQKNADNYCFFINDVATRR